MWYKGRVLTPAPCGSACDSTAPKELKNEPPSELPGTGTLEPSFPATFLRHAPASVHHRPIPDLNTPTQPCQRRFMIKLMGVDGLRKMRPLKRLLIRRSQEGFKMATQRSSDQTNARVSHPRSDCCHRSTHFTTSLIESLRGFSMDGSAGDLTADAAQMAVPGPAPKSNILCGLKSGSLICSSDMTCQAHQCEISAKSREERMHTCQLQLSPPQRNQLAGNTCCKAIESETENQIANLLFSGRMGQSCHYRGAEEIVPCTAQHR